MLRIWQKQLSAGWIKANILSESMSCMMGILAGIHGRRLLDVVERLRGKSIVKANIPVPLVQMVSSLNLMGAKLFGGSPMLTPGKVKELTHPDWVADNYPLASEIGWLPHVSLEDGLRQTFSLDV